MKTLGNIFWIICGGLISAAEWFLLGCLWYITIVGIPLGRQCFKFARLSLAPFGKEITYGGGAASKIANIFWMLFSGIPMAIEHFFLGVMLFASIIGIPLALQYFKLAKLYLAPFGAHID